MFSQIRHNQKLTDINNIALHWSFIQAERSRKLNLFSLHVFNTSDMLTCLKGLSSSL